MRDVLDIPLPPKPPPPKLGEATTEDMMKNPIKSMMAKARGEDLKKVSSRPSPALPRLASTLQHAWATGTENERARDPKLPRPPDRRRPSRSST